jgi:hypothetical protein
MEQRQIVDEKITFPIKGGSIYKSSEFCTWKELIETQGPISSDIIHDLFYKEVECRGWGEMSEDNEPSIWYVPTVTVIRPRPETDEEFEIRMRIKATFAQQNEERERLEYLRLKAKFETKNT